MEIRTLCLGILSLGDATGYEIKKMLQGSLSQIYEASYGSIYPSLNSLHNEGLVTCESLSQEKRPDKKIYAITHKGKEELINDFHEIPSLDKIRSEFLVMMLFAHMLPDDQISSIIQNRIKTYEQILKVLKISKKENVKQKTPEASEMFVLGYGIALIEAQLNYLKSKSHHLVIKPD
tara:strand:- start:1617 stop:2147 length:531 start_codon:yes stop_codon:yes gene_type:complete